jgi:prevent-host-death family protein
MGMNIWTVTQAKAKFGEVLNKAQSLGPQTIMRNGRSVAVVVAADEWERVTRRKGTLADFFASSPLRRSGLKINRLQGRVRKVSL